MLAQFQPISRPLPTILLRLLLCACVLFNGTASAMAAVRMSLVELDAATATAAAESSRGMPDCEQHPGMHAPPPVATNDGGHAHHMGPGMGHDKPHDTGHGGDGCAQICAKICMQNAPALSNVPCLLALPVAHASLLPPDVHRIDPMPSFPPTRPPIA